MRQIRSAWPFVAMDQSVLDRSVEVQDAPAKRGQQRGVKITDPLIAAAEASRLVVLHYDHVLDRIAEITGQTAEWIISAGTDSLSSEMCN